MKSFRDVIRLWPSADAMAAELDLRINTTRHWLTRDRIPAPYWKKVLDAAQAKGAVVSAEDFVDIVAIE